MTKTYEDALLSPDISWDLVTQGIEIPLNLYKYQSFVTENGDENPYWSANMNGQFHMSLGCEFEDINDCKPFFNKAVILKYFDNFFELSNMNLEQRDKMLNDIDNVLTEEYFIQVIKNYQNNIRIGCFTDDSNNKEMWNKYASQKKGYCIEYNTQKNILFDISMLPILYSDKPYDSSLTLQNSIIIECNKKAKGYSDEENLNRFEKITRRIIKTAYIPIFIKQKNVWQFEHEYRLFLLKSRSTRAGILKAEKFLDSNYNIDLSAAVSAIYLGENFDQNENYRVLLDKVTSICQAKKINLFRKAIEKGSEVDIKIV